jgi:hypothetical protein
MSYLLWVASIADALAATLKTRKVKIDLDLRKMSKNEGKDDMFTLATLNSHRSLILNSIICRTSTNRVFAM